MADTINDLDVVALLADLPEHGLKSGQIGTVVYMHDHGRAFEVEFIASPRRSIVATVTPDKLLKLRGLPALRSGAA